MIKAAQLPTRTAPRHNAAAPVARPLASAADLFGGPAPRPTLARLSAPPAAGLLSREHSRHLRSAGLLSFADTASQTAVVQRFRFQDLHFASRENPHQEVPGSIYFQAGGGNTPGRIRLGHSSGPAVERDNPAEVRHQVSEGHAAHLDQDDLDASHQVLGSALKIRRAASRAYRAAPTVPNRNRRDEANQAFLHRVGAYARPLDIDGPGRLLEYHTDAHGRVTGTHPSRGSPVTEGGVQNQAHLDRIIQAANAGHASITGAGNRVSRALKTWWHNKNVNSTYLSPPGTGRMRRMWNWLRA